MLLYMSQEGRGIGLLNKLKAYELQEQGLDTVEANLELGFPADERDWGIGNQILADLGLTTMRILTNNPKKLTGLEGYGLKVIEQVPIEMPPHPVNERYLATKRDKLGHRLHHQDIRFRPGGRMRRRRGWPGESAASEQGNVQEPEAHRRAGSVVAQPSRSRRPSAPSPRAGGRARASSSRSRSRRGEEEAAAEAAPEPAPAGHVPGELDSPTATR